MKKIVYFIPAIIFTVLYGLVLISGAFFGVSPIAYIWISLFFVSGILLSKGLFWGGVFGVLPGIHMMYMGTIDTGQIMSETPVGIIISVFYIVCSIAVFCKKRKSS